MDGLGTGGNPGYRLRPASAADGPAIARLYHRGWHEGHAGIVPPALLPDRTPATFRTRVAGLLNRCLVAEDGAHPVGFTAWNVSELAQLFIDPALQGRGLAPALLRAAEAAMRDGGVGEAFLTCVVGNARARAFYLRENWRPAGIEDYPARVGSAIVPVPVWRMTKRLGGPRAGAERP